MIEELLETYFRWMNFNGASHAYRQAVQLGVLDALVPHPATPEQVAEACGLQPKSTKLLLETLAALGVVEPMFESFRLTSMAEKILHSSYRNWGDEYWANLPKLLQTGEPMLALDEGAQSEAFYAQQAAALGWMLMPAAAKAVPLLAGEDSTPLAILDVGAGSAVWSLLLASELSGSHVTALDLPGVLPAARQTAEQFGISESLTTLAGDMLEAELPAETFDLAIVANVTHLQAWAKNQALIAKLRSALKPAGRLAIIDAFPGHPKGALNYHLYTLGLALRTKTGEVYSAATLTEQLILAGYRTPQFDLLDAAPHVLGMIVARK